MARRGHPQPQLCRAHPHLLSLAACKGDARAMPFPGMDLASGASHHSPSPRTEGCRARPGGNTWPEQSSRQDGKSSASPSVCTATRAQGQPLAPHWAPGFQRSQPQREQVSKRQLPVRMQSLRPVPAWATLAPFCPRGSGSATPQLSFTPQLAPEMATGSEWTVLSPERTLNLAGDALWWQM